MTDWRVTVYGGVEEALAKARVSPNANSGPKAAAMNSVGYEVD